MVGVVGAIDLTTARVLGGGRVGRPGPGHGGERRDVVGGDVWGRALDPGRDADGEVGRGDAVALGVLLAASADGPRPALGGRERGALADQVRQPRIAAREQLGDTRRMGGGQVEGGIAQEFDVGERRTPGRLDEGRAPGRHGGGDKLGRGGWFDDDDDGRPGGRSSTFGARVRSRAVSTRGGSHPCTLTGGPGNGADGSPGGSGDSGDSGREQCASRRGRRCALPSSSLGHRDVSVKCSYSGRVVRPAGYGYRCG